VRTSRSRTTQDLKLFTLIIRHNVNNLSGVYNENTNIFVRNDLDAVGNGESVLEQNVSLVRIKIVKNTDKS